MKKPLHYDWFIIRRTGFRSSQIKYLHRVVTGSYFTNEYVAAASYAKPTITHQIGQVENSFIECKRSDKLNSCNAPSASETNTTLVASTMPQDSFKAYVSSLDLEDIHPRHPTCVTTLECSVTRTYTEWKDSELPMTVKRDKRRKHHRGKPLKPLSSKWAEARSLTRWRSLEP